MNCSDLPYILKEKTDRLLYLIGRRVYMKDDNTILKLVIDEIIISKQKDVLLKASVFPGYKEYYILKLSDYNVGWTDIYANVEKIFKYPHGDLFSFDYNDDPLI